MRLEDLYIGQQVIVQMAWGEQKIEFFSDVLEKTGKGVFLTPYIHQDKPLELTIENSGRVTCSIFATSVETGQRRSWRNIELTTVNRNGEKAYLVKTNGFNVMSNSEDRRQNARMVIHKDGIALDPVTKLHVNVKIHDISDVGISFYAPPLFEISSHQLVVMFDDTVNGQVFNMKIDCTPVRNKKVGGLVFWGCKLTGQNGDFLLYSFLLRLMSKKREKDTEEAVEEELEEELAEEAAKEAAEEAADEAAEKAAKENAASAEEAKESENSN